MVGSSGVEASIGATKGWSPELANMVGVGHLTVALDIADKAGVGHMS